MVSIEGKGGEGKGREGKGREGKGREKRGVDKQMGREEKRKMREEGKIKRNGK